MSTKPSSSAAAKHLITYAIGTAPHYADRAARDQIVSNPIAHGMVPDALAVLDFAEPGFVSGRREVTNVPEQALFMLNSPTLATAAQKLAERVLTAHPATASLAQRVQFAYGLVFSRSPSEAEQKAAYDFFSKFHVTRREGGRDVEWQRLDAVWDHLFEGPAIRAYLNEHIAQVTGKTNLP